MQDNSSGRVAIEFQNTNLCSFTDDPTQNPYVVYSGHIVGMNDAPPSKTDTKPLDRGSDEVKLNR